MSALIFCTSANSDRKVTIGKCEPHHQPEFKGTIEGHGLYQEGGKKDQVRNHSCRVATISGSGLDWGYIPVLLFTHLCFWKS